MGRYERECLRNAPGGDRQELLGFCGRLYVLDGKLTGVTPRRRQLRLFLLGLLGFPSSFVSVSHGR